MSNLKKLSKGIRPFIYGMLLLIALASVAYAAPDGIFNDSCNSALACRETRNNGSGIGLYGYSGQYIGVKGQGGTGYGDYGGYFSAYEGVRGIATGVNGYGTWGTSSGANGIGAYGGSSGVSGYGVSGYSSQNIGVRGISTGTDVGDYGGYFTATGRGLYANGGSNRFDGFFPDCISVDGVAYGNCASALQNTLASGMALRAVNNDDEALSPGDAVVFNGVTTIEGLTSPILLVKKATGAANEAVIGVVQGAYVQELPSGTVAQAEAKVDVSPVAIPDKDDEGSSMFIAPDPAMIEVLTDNPDDAGYFAEGNVQSGQQLFVQVQGIALVNVDASTTAIVAGESLVVSPTGVAVTASRRLNDTASGLVVGRALESLNNGKGAVYVLLGVR